MVARTGERDELGEGKQDRGRVGEPLGLSTSPTSTNSFYSGGHLATYRSRGSQRRGSQSLHIHTHSKKAQANVRTTVCLGLSRWTPAPHRAQATQARTSRDEGNASGGPDVEEGDTTAPGQGTRVHVNGQDAVEPVGVIRKGRSGF